MAARIKNALCYKKPAFWVLILSVAAVILVVVCLLTNPVKGLELPDAASVLSMEMEQFNAGESLGPVVVTDSGDIETVLSALSGARKTLRQSVNDAPTQSNYLKVRLILQGEGELRTLFLYTEGNSYYVEAPYIGVYRSSRDASVTVYTIYNAAQDNPLTLKWKNIKVGTPRETVLKIMGEPDLRLSGMYGEGYSLDDGVHLIFYYDEESLVRWVYKDGKMVEPPETAGSAQQNEKDPSEIQNLATLDNNKEDYLHSLTDNDVTTAQKVAEAYYKTMPYSLTAIDLDSDMGSFLWEIHGWGNDNNPDAARFTFGNLIVFDTRISEFPETPRQIALGRENASARWEVINEGW